ncbi:MAG: TIGR04141 family sporadically distributed protein, partial [Angelakisella sp.]
SVLFESLDFELEEAIKKRTIDHLHIAPPETTDWERIIGFCYSGTGKKKEDADSYSLNLDLSEYLDKIRPDTNIYEKIKRDKLLAMTVDEVPFAICSIYAAMVFQTELEGITYILCSGNWYQIDQSFFNTVHDFVRNRVPISTFSLPDCPSNMNEGDYNEFVANDNSDFCLMDKKMVGVEDGPKKIEACDIFTISKQFIHVKNKGQSSQLSHLFSQGKISAQCFISDEKYRQQISDIAQSRYGKNIFDYHSKPRSNEFEIVYAIIDDKDTPISKKLPFFSLVNLMLTIKDLDRMQFKYSICFIKRV